MRWVLASISFGPQGNHSPGRPSNFPKVTQLGRTTARTQCLCFLTAEPLGAQIPADMLLGRGVRIPASNAIMRINGRTSGSHMTEFPPKSSSRRPSLHSGNYSGKACSCQEEECSPFCPLYSPSKAESPACMQVVLRPPSVCILSHPGVVGRECLPTIRHLPPHPQTSSLSVPYPTNSNLNLNQLPGDPRKALSL